VKDGISIARAQAEIETVQSGLARLYPKENEGWGAQVVPLAESLGALLVLLGAVGLVFLIACANVANLLLARAGGRAREVAIRTALGAGRGRLIRQFLTECLVLALAGGTLGVLLAWAAMGALRAWISPDLIRSSDIALDLRVLAFSFAVSLLAAIVFGLAPAIEASGTNLSDPLREGAAATGESGRRKRTRNLLVIGETAFSFVLLIGAGLLGKSFLRLRDVPLGFRPARVLTAGMSLPRSQYSRPEQWIGFYTRLVERLKSDPGVEGVTAALPLPLNGGGLNFAFKIEGRSAERAGDDLSANYTAATGDYFRVLGVPIQRGRALADSDSAASPKVCVISSSFARRFFPGENPIGRRLVFGFKDSVPREIVGITSRTKLTGRGFAESLTRMEKSAVWPPAATLIVCIPSALG
jgi:predicted permease